MPLSGSEIVEGIKILIGFAALWSVRIAHSAYKTNLIKQDEDRVRDSDKELLNQSEKSLQWAYDALTDEKKNLPPHSDRLNWLTCARHIKRHDVLASKIKSETYKTVHAEIEEFWRHKFYVALNDAGLSKPSYFGSANFSTSPNRIDPTSALVVLTFSRWKKENADPLDKIDWITLIGNGDVFKSTAGHGLQEYLNELDNWRTHRNRTTSSNDDAK